jgi:hypothetical protein
MALAPRVVIVHRRTELEELLWRHGTRGQAAFFLATRNRGIEDVAARHDAVQAALASVSAAIPAQWRRGMVEREDLPRFGFEPEDVVVAVGQDGLVANLAKYLSDQLVIGINPEPDRNPGVLVPHPPGRATDLLAAAAGDGRLVETLSMVRVTTDDGQELTALNELYLGQATHQTARYTLTLPSGQAEAQASSGLIVSTGTGATGWCGSASLERKSTLELPRPADRRLVWFVREAWPSPATGTCCTEGELDGPDELALSAESDRLVVFGDGIEADAITVSWGQSVRVGLAGRTLHVLMG